MAALGASPEALPGHLPTLVSQRRVSLFGPSLPFVSEDPPATLYCSAYGRRRFAKGAEGCHDSVRALPSAWSL
jgi:hypothetical protein